MAEHERGNARPMKMFHCNSKTRLPQEMRAATCRHAIAPNQDASCAAAIRMVSDQYQSIPRRTDEYGIRGLKPFFCLSRDSQQPDRVLTQDCALVGVAQAGCAQDMIHWRGGPGKREIGPDHDLAGAALGNQVPKRFRAEDQRVGIDLLAQILCWVFLERFGVAAGACRTTVIGPIGVGCEIAATMSTADLQPRIAIERTVEDQMGKEDGGFERIADYVAQPPVARQSFVQLRNALGMHENQDTEFLGLGPEGIELG